MNLARRLVNPGNPALARLLPPPVAGILLTRWKLDFDRMQVLVRYLREQVRNAVQSRALLVVGINDEPWGLLAVGVLEHDVLRFRVLDPVLACLKVHGTQLPALDRIAHALGKTPFLLLAVQREPEN